MKRKLIELLIRLWMPKYKLARIRGPYRKRVLDPVIDPKSGAFQDV